MKIIAIVLNLVVLVSSFVIGIKEDLFSPSEEGLLFLWFWLLIVTPIVSIISLITLRSDSWLSLYFERKALEEKQRITELDKKLDD